MKLLEVDRGKLSPMMLQYAEIKDNYPSELVFFRLGDFYELFFEDAIIASRELELTLTGKVAGLKERVPMCGVPHHAVKNYLERLINKGYKVAICEQLENPKNVKGVVKRGVVNVVSRGTIADFELLDERSESFISSVLKFPDIYLITYLDISTGHLSTVKINLSEESLINEILSLGIKEVILNDNLNSHLIEILKNSYGIEVTISSEFLEKDYPKFIDEENDYRIKTGLKHIFYYLQIKLLKDLSNIDKVEIINKLNYLEMDIHTIRNLELIETLRLKERTYSLFWLLDKCKTAMGSRKLKNWLLNPLKDINKINERNDKIEKLSTEFILKAELRELLNEVYDLERLTGKITNGSVNARDLIQLKNSLKVLPDILNIIQKIKFNYNFSTHNDLYNIIEKAINDDAPFTLKEGGLIKKGYNEELDELKIVRSGGKNYIANFEKKIKEETGIKNLKIGFNKIFGYYIEVTKGSIKEIKPDFGFERRQTLANAERYVSKELKEKEVIILTAEEKIFTLEYNLFMEIKEIIKTEISDIKKTADIISQLDVISSLSECADHYNLVRPKLNDKKIMNIIEGRHPVVEIVNKNHYVPNDCFMDSNSSTLLITGPNMSGKSTYMRQMAIITIMAQMGSFVPAKSAEIAIVDKIFTRIGASDDLVSGESTFMVEMKEARNAICNATPNSLILFDELGRGTATYDGIAIAKAILEYVSENIKCFTLFSTHYHELTTLDKLYSNIKNIHVSAIEEGNKITFLHKIKNGPVDKSYGIHVAKLADLPDNLINRANEILNEYESNGKKEKVNHNKVQLTLAFDEEKQENKLLHKIKEINPLDITPMEALNYLFELKNEMEKEEIK